MSPSEEEVWAYTGESRRWKGHLYLNGKMVWTCRHEHDTQREAKACARIKLKTLRQRKKA